MRINFDRLSQLAGLPSNGSNTRRGLYEGAETGMPGDLSELETEGRGHYNEDEGRGHTDEGRGDGGPPVDEEEEADEMAGMDELIEIDEVMLVQELRRAKRIMNENKRRRMNESRKRNAFESQLKQVIDEEVQNVMSEMNLNSQWVYGDRRPTRSRKGYSHQGSFLPGLGFRK